MLVLSRLLMNSFIHRISFISIIFITYTFRIITYIYIYYKNDNNQRFVKLYKILSRDGMPHATKIYRDMLNEMLLCEQFTTGQVYN